MEACKEAVSVRASRLSSRLLNKKKGALDLDVLGKEGLLDAFQVLYDECNSDYLKNTDPLVTNFVARCRTTAGELRKLRVNLSDFEVKDAVGRGHFGEVHVVKEKQTGDVYAMKTVRKYENGGRCVSFETERNVMATLDSSWITRLQYAFQDSTNLYFVMEYHPGGDLLGLLYRQGGTIPETAAIFYLAELAVALNELHEMGFVHRDVKPDNILLDRCGHIKLADFGSAAKLTSEGLAIGDVPVGTPDYVAPEVLQSLNGKGKEKLSYGKSCDFWSLGIIAYELTIGQTPFAADNTPATYARIMNHSKSLKFPSDVLLSLAYISFIKSLLTDENNRLRHGQIVRHALFKTSNLNGLRDQVPPFVPKVGCEEDSSNFTGCNVKGEKKLPNIENFKRRTQFSGRNLPFIGFTYVTESDMVERRKVPIKIDESIALRSEIDLLKKSLLQMDELGKARDVLEKKLAEKSKKLEISEHVRDKLEMNLTNTLAENQAMKRTLQLERTDRANIETKALNLVKMAKTKWEASEKSKIDNLRYDMEQIREKNKKLTGTVDELNSQLGKALQLTNKHKASVENVEKLRRSSVIGLETRLEKITMDTQTRITELQAELTAVNEDRVLLERELKEANTEREEFKAKLHSMTASRDEAKEKNERSARLIGELQQDVEDLQACCKDIEKYKRTCDELQLELRDTKANVKNESSNGFVLKKQIKDLKSELNSMLTAKLTSEEQKGFYERKINELESNIKTLTCDRDSYNDKLIQSELNLASKEEKLNSFEELLKRLQSNLEKLETGGERESILQEQIQRLETQLAEMHEKSAVEKQESAQLKTKFWRMEKELTNANLDKKIIERDVKELSDQNVKLLSELDELKSTVDACKKSKESAVRELGTLNENLHDELSELKEEIKSLQEKLVVEKAAGVNHRDLVDSHRREIESKEANICKLLADLDDLKKAKSNVEEKLRRGENERITLVRSFDELQRDKSNALNEANSTRLELENSLLNRQALREACTVLESQLIEFETVLECSEAKRQRLETELDRVLADGVETKTELQCAKKATNEEKSLRLLADTKSKRLAEDIEHLQKELDCYKKTSNDFKACATNLSDELTEAESKITEFEMTMKSYERQIDTYIAESNYLKEENSEQLTAINGLKESNYNLEKRHAETKALNSELKSRLKELEDLVSESNLLHSQRETKAQSQMQQQSKLIDYLHSKLDEFGKKKKTFSDKLFGHSKKENVPPVSITLNYRDLETSLSKAKEENRHLNREIVRLKAELYKNEENEHAAAAAVNVQIQDEVLAQIVRSPRSQKNDFYRHNSFQRMHHNIPHRFESKIGTKLIRCKHCSEQILLGRNVSICSACGVHAHPNCAALLPRTCGLPNAFAKHYTDSLTRLTHSTHTQNDDSQTTIEEINIEGWVKVPVGSSGWVRHYARLTTLALSVYKDYGETEPVMSVRVLSGQTERGKVILEPLPSEIGIPVANSDLPFIIKVESGSSTTCWPTDCIVFMTLSVEDKDRWFKGLQSVFRVTDKSDVIFETEELRINVLAELDDTRLLGTDTGLYALQSEKLLRIAGLEKVHEIELFPSINSALMIIDDNRVLISCSLKHLISLTECAPCSKPTLKYRNVDVKNLNGFHIIKSADFTRNKIICLANAKQLMIMRYDLIEKEFVIQRVLDTAEPVSCVLFSDHSIIIGADKFFEVELNGFQADEFLDASDSKLTRAVKCYRIKSFPLSIQQISKLPIEYLVCFNEFATFVDAYGRSTRSSDIKFPHLPRAFHFAHPYLYVVHYNSVEMYKIDARTCSGSEVSISFIKIELENPELLASNDIGVFIGTNKTVRFINARVLDDDASIATTERRLEDLNEDRFSFTSSIMQSLDGNLTDEEEPVKFSTDL